MKMASMCLYKQFLGLIIPVSTQLCTRGVDMLKV